MLITRDFLGGCCTIDSKELDLDLQVPTGWEKRLYLKSFHFASIYAFGLLAYVGYIVYAFPSLFRLHRLNGLLLVFILLWAISTYIFNVAFTFLNWKLGKDMEIWELVGIWHYPIPGFFLLAQFCLRILVALCNLVSNSVFLYLSDEDGRCSNDNTIVEDNGKLY